MDAADAFHRAKMPARLCEYFGPPSAAAAELGLSRQSGAPLLSEAEVPPLAASLPAGFTWSLFFA